MCFPTNLSDPIVHGATGREVYGSGEGICETLWGQSFLYSQDSQSDPNRQCMTLWWPEGSSNPNAVALDNLFSAAAAATLSSIAVLVSMVPMAIVLMYST